MIFDQIQNHPVRTVLKGIVGAGSPVLAAVTSCQEQIEWWLRIACMLAGLAVSMLTIRSLLKRPERQIEPRESPLDY